MDTRRVRMYRPPLHLEVDGGRDLITALCPVRERTTPLKLPRKTTPLGKYIKRYCMLYGVSFGEVAALMQSIDSEWCSDVTADEVELWVQRGKVPTVFQFQTICYILGVKNPWVLRPRGQGNKMRLTADVKGYEYADNSVVEDLTDGEDVKLPIEYTLEKKESMARDIEVLHNNESHAPI